MKGYSNENLKFNTIEVSILMIIGIMLGLIIGFTLTYGKGLAKEVDNNDNFNDFLEIYDELVDNSYNNISKNELTVSSIKGLFSSIDDPFASYLNKEQTKNYHDEFSGQFVGLGISVVERNENFYISNVIKDGPSHKAGVKKDDRIISIDNKNVVDLDLDDISKLIRNDKKSVKLLVNRNGKQLTFRLKKDKIDVSSVYSNIFLKNNKSIGYIYISTFYDNTYSQFISTLKYLESNDIDSLIIDVRDNFGGSLRQLDLILSEFFEKNKVLYYTISRYETEEILDLNDTKRSYDIVVLCNKNTISSAEILVSAFKDNYDNSTIIGEQTYGKRSIQTVKNLSSGASLKYTHKKWLTSKGEFKDNIGIEPDILIEDLNKNYKKTSDVDEQFKKAIELLSK